MHIQTCTHVYINIFAYTTCAHISFSYLHTNDWPSFNRMIWYCLWNFLTFNSYDWNISPLSNNINAIKAISIPSIVSEQLAYISHPTTVHIRLSLKITTYIFPQASWHQVPNFSKIIFSKNQIVWKIHWDFSTLYVPTCLSSYMSFLLQTIITTGVVLFTASLNLSHKVET